MKLKLTYLARNIILGFVIVIIIVILINYLSVLTKYSSWLYLIVVLFLALLYEYFKNRTNKFVNGFVGERDIDDELKNLGSEYLCISQGLNTASGNIDKIVIGPTGVWTLEVKSHSGNVTFDGEGLLRNGQPLEKNFLGQAYAEAKTLEDLIKEKINLYVPVKPVVVFSNNYARVNLGLKQHKEVNVVQKRWLIKLLNQYQTVTLSTETINKIATIFK